jgi:hypothetical protein
LRCPRWAYNIRSLFLIYFNYTPTDYQFQGDDDGTDPFRHMPQHHHPPSLSRTMTSHDLTWHPIEHYRIYSATNHFYFAAYRLYSNLLFRFYSTALFLTFSCFRNSYRPTSNLFPVPETLTALLPTFSCSHNSYTLAIPPLLCFVSLTLHFTSVTLATG